MVSDVDLNKYKVIVDQALLAFNERDFGKSSQLCMDFLGQMPDPILKAVSDAFHMAGLIELSKGLNKAGKTKLEKAAVLYPPNSQVHAHLGYYIAEMENNIFQAQEKLKKAKAFNREDPSIKRLENLLLKLKRDRLPGVIINSMPQSGANSIWNMLQVGLGLPGIIITNYVRSFKNEIVDHQKTIRVIHEGGVGQGQMAATNVNLSLLSRSGADRLIIHVIDPRQAMLSWIHYIDKLHKVKEFTVSDYPLCKEYFSLTVKNQIECHQYFSKNLEEKIDVHIEHYLPLLIDWLAGWMEHEEIPKCSIKVKFTFSDDLKFRPEKFYKEILSFYDISMDRFKMPDFEVYEKGNSKNGLVEEFRAVFSDKQMDKVNAMIPDRIFNKFGWRK